MGQARLVLFDIDGTLLHSGGAGKRAMNRAFEILLGIQDALDGVDLAGRTDENIFQSALQKYELVMSQNLLSEFKNHYFAILPDELNHRSPGKRLYPGVLELLQAIHDHPSLIIGLLTGNWERSAYIKLTMLGIDGYFELGAFADDSADRNQLLPFALERVHQRKGLRINSQNVYVIGDTPLDIACAHRHHAIAIAVATGNYTLEQLHADQPDYLLKNLSDTTMIMAILLNNKTRYYANWHDE